MVLLPSPYPSPRHQVIPDLDYPSEALTLTHRGVDPGSPAHGIVPSSNFSDHNSDEWILGPWPSRRNSQTNLGGEYNMQGPPAMARPSHHRSQSNTQAVPHQYHGGAQNPFNNYTQAPPGTGWMGQVPLPGGPPPGSPRGQPGYVPAYPPMGSPYVQPGMLSPYQGHQQPPPPMPGMGGIPGMGQQGWGGALVPAGALVQYQPQQAKLARPKEEEIVAIDRWEPGKDYGVILDSIKFNVLRPPVVVHALLGPTPPSASHPSLVFNMLFPPNMIHLSNEHPSRSWMNGRSDPATFPRLSHISLISPHFPWIIEVRNDQGVTCGDVAQKLFNFMQARIDKSEWEPLPEEDRLAIGASYKWNRSTEPGAPGGMMQPGLSRVDFLGKRTMFDGMVRDDKFVRERLSTSTGAVFVVILAER